MKKIVKYLLWTFMTMSCLMATAGISTMVHPDSEVPSTESSIFRRDFSTIEFSTPNEWSFHKYIEKPVNLYNGSIDVSVPIYELKDGEVTLPLTLRYNTSGIRVDEEASWVGLGWNLNVGGYITCRVVGGYDNSDVLFDTGYRDLFYGSGAGYTNTYGSIPITEQMYNSLLLGVTEGMNFRYGKLQPDVYYFSYPGNAGRYVVDHRDNSLIVLQRENDTKIENDGKVITTPEGIQHHYDDQYMTTPSTSFLPISVTYPLTSTVYPNGSTVLYNYGSYPIEKRSGSASASGSLNAGNYMYYTCFNERSELNHNSSTLCSEESFLQEIRTPNYRIVFDSGDRLDIVSTDPLNPSKRLNGIRITTLDGSVCLKEFRFEYGYFGTEDGGEGNNRKLRLKLTGIREMDPSGSGESINHYSFGYNDANRFPPKDSYASDYWGYVNGNGDINCSDYLPDLKKLYWYRQNDADYSKITAHAYPVYDKSHNARLCATGMLNSITYPTGGRTELCYESNSFWGIWIPSVNENADTAAIVRHTIVDRNNAADNTSISIQENGIREYHINYTLSRGLNSWGTLANNPPYINVPFANSGAQTGMIVNFADECRRLNDIGSSASSISGSVTVSSRYGGTTVFQLVFPNSLGDQFSSGGNHGALSADVWYRDAEPGTMALERESYGCGMRIAEIKHYDANSNSPESVTSYSYDDPSTGHTSGCLFDRPRYETVYEYAMIPLRANTTPAYIPHRMFEISSSSVIDNPYGWSSGVGYSLVTERVTGSAGSRVHRFINDAANDSQVPVRVANALNGKLSSETLLDEAGNEVSKTEYGYRLRESAHYNGVILVNNILKGAELINYSDQFWHMDGIGVGHSVYAPNCIQAFTYALNQNDVWLANKTVTMDGVSKRISYGVDESSLLCEWESFVDSDGSTIKTEYRYPKDFSVYNSLVGRHIISPVVESRILRNGSLIHATLSTYDDNGNRDAVYYSSISGNNASGLGAFSGSSPNPALYPVDAIEITARDQRGNPLAMRTGGMEDEVTVWGYGYRYPVARIKGVGKQVVEQALGCTLQSISAQIEPDFAMLDALRTSLTGALVETASYDRLGNVTALADAGGNRQMFEYDAYGRLASKSRTNNNQVEPTDGYIYTDTSIEHRSYLTTDSYFRDICHYNGLGLPEQMVSVEANSVNSSNVCQVYHDAALRECRKYLPFEYQSVSGDKVADSIQKTLQYWNNEYGASEQCPFTEEEYESAPSWRPVKQYKAGSSFRNAGKYVGMEYGTNVAREVRRLYINTSGALACGGYYAAAELNRTKVTDEDGKTSITFTNKMGLTVLERKIAGTGIFADTYYVYDSFCRLAIVVTPEGSYRLADNASYAATTTFVTEYCYRFTYDSRRRRTHTYYPGGKYEISLYDNLDRQIIFRNNRSGWMTFQYDVCGRLVGQKHFTAPIPDSAIISNPQNYVIYGTDCCQYVHDSYPDSNPELAFLPVSGVVTAADLRDSNNGLKLQETICDVAQEGQSNPASVVRRFYYDYLNRPVQIVEKTLWGDILRTSYSYDYRGNILCSVESVKGTVKKQNFSYDSRGRLTNETTFINGVQKSTVSSSYDILDRPVEIGMGLNNLKENYAYNIQGWNTTRTVKKGTITLYTSTLRYNTPYLGSTASYNGNVSSWSTSMNGVSGTKTYTYSYDALGRLIDAQQYSGNTANAAFTERNIGYDRNGNILALERYENGLSTEMSFTYSGNKRSGYDYDNAGNITHKPGDSYNVSYNRLGMPSVVSPGNGNSGSTYTYRYLADGTKVSELDENGNGYKYLGSMRFAATSSADMFESTPFGKGRIVCQPTNNSAEAQYYVTDHIGSTRIILSSSGNVLARYEYTPFGVSRPVGMTASATTDFRFSGKEIQPFGNVVDFGARLYDPRLALWNSVDPLAEKYFSISPYAYCNNNPVIFVDPDGEEVIMSFMSKYPSAKGRYKTYGSIIQEQNDFKRDRRLMFSISQARHFDNLVEVYAHGSKDGSVVYTYDSEDRKITNRANGLMTFIQSNSKTLDESSPSAIILNCCNTGKESGLASSLSEIMNNTIIVAPTGEAHPNGNIDGGNWQVYFNGVVTYSVDGNENDYEWLLSEISSNIHDFINRYCLFPNID